MSRKISRNLIDKWLKVDYNKINDRDNKIIKWVRVASERKWYNEQWTNGKR